MLPTSPEGDLDQRGFSGPLKIGPAHHTGNHMLSTCSGVHNYVLLLRNCDGFYELTDSLQKVNGALIFF
jgi:hypothetical protein